MMPIPKPTPDSLNDALCGGDPLARALARLAPAPADLATPGFLFAAGAAAESRRTRFWQRLCLGQAALTGLGVVTLALVLTQPPATAPVELPPAFAAVPDELAPMPREHVPAPTYPVEPTHFAARPREDGPTLDERVRALQLRNDILLGGLGLLPDAAAPPHRSPFDGPAGPHGGVFAAPTFPERPTAPPSTPENDR
jgi:hypothetical protein